MASSSPFRSPVPSAAPTAPDASPSNASALMDEAQTQSAQSSQTEMDANRQFVTILRRVHDDIDTLTRMRPEFAPFGRGAKQQLTNGMVKVVASNGGAGTTSRQPTPTI